MSSTDYLYVGEKKKTFGGKCVFNITIERHSIIFLNSFTAQNINVGVTYCGYLNHSDSRARLNTAPCSSQYHTSELKLSPKSE